jgi:pSer/pThr/pTyr-binding forkhead associated (FHA) protein
MDTQVDKSLDDTVTERRPEIYLMVMSGPEDGRIFPLAKESTSIGRLDSNDVALMLDPFVSRAHARVTREGERFLISDLDSKFGTDVDGVKVPPGGKSELRHESMIRVGETLLVFRTAEKRGSQP